MKRLIVASLIILAAPICGAMAEGPSADHGARLYQRCAACHLPNGAGVPGAFPALAGRVNVAAANEAGRDYLVMVVAAGVMGEIYVDGSRLRGVMPAQAGMSDADIAAVLNYAATLKGQAAKAFTAEEVAAIRARHQGANPTSVHAIRSGVFELQTAAPVAAPVAAPAPDKPSGAEK